MLIKHYHFAPPLLNGRSCSGSPSGRQQGIVLLIALMVLVVLSLAGLALMRTVDTTNLVAGNLAFQRSATFSAETGVETAITRLWAAVTAGPTVLHEDHTGTGGWAYYASASKDTQPSARRYPGYKSYGENPVTASDWDEYWVTAINPNPEAGPVCKERACILATDGVGNTVSYTIQRLCDKEGDPANDTTGCVPSPSVYAKSGNSSGSQNTTFPGKSQVYYRITTRVTGPRSTVSYVQTIVAI